MRYSGFTFFVIALLFVQVVNAQTSKKNSNQYAKTELHEALTNTLQKQVLVDTVISDEKTAVKVAEAILFKAYGKDEISAERPYKVNNVNGYWVLEGTKPTEWLGGIFLIIIRAKDGQVIKLTHGK